jgi:hypothetical protein
MKKKKVDWKAITEEVNSRLKSNHSEQYIRGVYRGSLVSAKVSEILKEKLPPFEKPERFSLYDKYPGDPEEALRAMFKRGPVEPGE